MTAPDDTPRNEPTAAASVYEQALAAVARSVDEELRAAHDRLATPAEIEPLRHRLAALGSMRQRL